MKPKSRELSCIFLISIIILLFACEANPANISNPSTEIEHGEAPTLAEVFPFLEIYSDSATAANLANACKLFKQAETRFGGRLANDNPEGLLAFQTACTEDLAEEVLKHSGPGPLIEGVIRAIELTPEHPYLFLVMASELPKFYPDYHFSQAISHPISIGENVLNSKPEESRLGWTVALIDKDERRKLQIVGFLILEEHEFELLRESYDLTQSEMDLMIFNYRMLLLKLLVDKLPGPVLDNLEELHQFLAGVPWFSSNSYNPKNWQVTIADRFLYSDPKLFKEHQDRLLGRDQVLAEGYSFSSSVLENLQLLIRGRTADESFEELIKLNNPILTGLFNAIPNDWVKSELPGLSSLDILDMKMAAIRNLGRRFGSYRLSQFMVQGGLEKSFKFEVAEILRTRKKHADELVLKGDVFHVAHWGKEGPKMNFGNTKIQELMYRHTKDAGGNYHLFHGITLQGKSKTQREEELNAFLEGYITASGSARLILEGHAHGSGFSVYVEGAGGNTESTTRQGTRASTELTRAALGQIIQRRIDYRKEMKIPPSEMDMMLFVGCRGELATNSLTDAKLINAGFWWDSSPSLIVVSGNEVGQNIVFNPSKEIPVEYFREIVPLESNSPITIGDIGKNQHSENATSNPMVIIPIKMSNHTFGEQWVAADIY